KRSKPFEGDTLPGKVREPTPIEGKYHKGDERRKDECEEERDITAKQPLNHPVSHAQTLFPENTARLIAKNTVISVNSITTEITAALGKLDCPWIEFTIKMERVGRAPPPTNAGDTKSPRAIMNAKANPTKIAPRAKGSTIVKTDRNLPAPRLFAAS